ncbi:hypothetical protein AB6D90_02185 [Vibrio splendidus]|uniref:hypothetical protein n=1 Tax=Vibrio splendidus TaxID=29497 RepID=UPI0006CA3F0C|nr:hypothetical protein [Vibrio splendidus]KPL97236.1 hypothetical protein AN167_23850 [Vibrio splendidus]
MNVPEVMSKWKTLLALTMALFVERIELKEHPVLFTLIIISWFVMGGVYFYMDNRVFEFFSSL